MPAVIDIDRSGSAARERRHARGATEAKMPARAPALPGRESTSTSPALHWSDRYLGRPYIEGARDCADFAVEVLRDVFGRDVRLPRPDRAGGAATARARDRAVETLAGIHAAPLADGEAPREGDGVSMRARGRRRAVGRHIGLWARVGGAPCVVHCMAGAGVVRHELASLPARGLECTGIWRWL